MQQRLKVCDFCCGQGHIQIDPQEERFRTILALCALGLSTILIIAVSIDGIIHGNYLNAFLAAIIAFSAILTLTKRWKMWADESVAELDFWTQLSSGHIPTTLYQMICQEVGTVQAIYLCELLILLRDNKVKVKEPE